MVAHSWEEKKFFEKGRKDTLGNDTPSDRWYECLFCGMIVNNPETKRKYDYLYPCRIPF